VVDDHHRGSPPGFGHRRLRLDGSPFCATADWRDHPGSRRYVRPVRGFPARAASTVLSPCRYCTVLPNRVPSSGGRRIWRDADGCDQFASRGTRGRYGGDRLQPVPGNRARQPPRPQGMRPKDASEAAAPQRREPRQSWPPFRPSRALSSPSVARAWARARSWPSGPARRRCALEAVVKVVTA
jgi:hypothetical protein